MTLVDVIDEVKLELTGGVLDLEIEDVTIELVVKKVLRELQRYWDETSFVTIPFESCIDLEKYQLDSCSIVKVYRTTGLGTASTDVNTATMDPLYAQQFMRNLANRFTGLMIDTVNDKIFCKINCIN